MISGFRKSLRSWATVALLFLALMAIVVTGFGTGGFGGLGSLGSGGSDPADVLATVETTDVKASEVSDLLNRQYAAARAQQPGLEMRDFLAQGMFDLTLNQLIARAAIRHYAAERGLAVSDEMIDDAIRNEQRFRNFTGQFDMSLFRQFLAEERINEAWLRENLRGEILQRQLIAPIATGARVPQSIAREYANLELERRRGSIGIVPADAFAAGINPTDAEIATFYRQNQRLFIQPERRVIRYAVVGPEQVGQAGAATEAEIARVYRANQGRFGPRETRTIQHLPLQRAQQARQAAERLRGGASFAEVASQLGYAASDLTYAEQSRESLAREVPDAVVRAAFATARGQVGGPIQADGVFHVVRVETVTTTPGRSLDQARPEIVAFIERRKRVDALNDLVNRLQEQLDDGTPFEQVVRGERLALVTTPAITAGGQAPAGSPPWQPAPELRPLLAIAFGIDAEDLEPMIEQLGDNRFALLEVQRVDPAAPPPLAQIRDRVRTALIQRRALERARAAATALVRRINAGTPIAAAFAGSQPRLNPPEAVDMVRAQASQQPHPALDALFSLPQGRAHLVPAPNNGGFLVVFHAERIAGNAGNNPQLVTRRRTELAGAAAEELAQQFVRSIELKSEISRNEDAIRRSRNAAMGVLE